MCQGKDYNLITITGAVAFLSVIKAKIDQTIADTIGTSHQI